MSDNGPTIDEERASWEVHKKRLNDEAARHRLAAKAEKERADAFATEVENLKSNLAARPAGESGDPSPAATGVPAPQPAPDPAAAATSNLLAEVAARRLLNHLPTVDPERVVRNVLANADEVSEEGVLLCEGEPLTVEILRERLPENLLLSSGAAGSGSRAPMPAAIAAPPQGVDWNRMRVDSNYRQDPKIRALAEAEAADAMRRG